MVSEEKQYEFACSAQIAANERLSDALKIFVQTLTAIVGGSIWLALTLRQLTPSAKIFGEPAALSFGIMAFVLICFLYIICIAIVVRSMLALNKYKNIELKLCATRDDGVERSETHYATRTYTQLWVETFIISAMSSVVYLFWAFNPFWILK
ncbi:MAG: hypothetical protein WCA78_01155 [Rhizomicrobium sp.]